MLPSASFEPEPSSVQVYVGAGPQLTVNAATGGRGAATIATGLVMALVAPRESVTVSVRSMVCGVAYCTPMNFPLPIVWLPTVHVHARTPRSSVELEPSKLQNSDGLQEVVKLATGGW